MSNDKKHFPNGLFYKKPNDNAPDFVMGKVSIKVDDFKKYLNKVNGEWLNLDLKISKDGKGYAEVDTWKPDPSKNGTPPKNEVPNDFDDMDDDLPF